MDNYLCQNCGFTNRPTAVRCARCNQVIGRLPYGVLFRARGISANLELTQNSIIIRREGKSSIFLHGLKGDKEIPLSKISSIQFKEPGIVNGYIQFTFSGGSEAKRGIWEAAGDENTIMFSRQRWIEFNQIKNEIQKRMNGSSQVISSNPLDDLEKLASLRDKGVISNEEFEVKKKQILG